MPIVDPQEFGTFLMNAIPGRKRRLEEEPPDDPVAGDPIDTLRLAKQTRQTGAELYPTHPLSTEQVQRLQSLSNRERRLAPAQGFQYGEVGSRGNPSNPFSIDTRGAARGLGNLIVGLANKAKAKRRGTFEPELAGLSRQEQENIKNTEQQDKFFQKAYPGLLTQAGENARNDADNERITATNNANISSRENINDANIESKEKIAKAKAEADKKAAEDERTFKRSLESQKYQHEKLLKNATASGSGLPTSFATSVSRLNAQTANTLFKQADDLEKRLGDPLTSYTLSAAQQENLRNKAKDLRNKGYQFMSLGAEPFTGSNFTGAIQDYQKLVEGLGSGTSGNDDIPDYVRRPATSDNTVTDVGDLFGGGAN